MKTALHGICSFIIKGWRIRCVTRANIYRDKINEILAGVPNKPQLSRNGGGEKKWSGVPGIGLINPDNIMAVKSLIVPCPLYVRSRLGLGSEEDHV